MNTEHSSDLNIFQFEYSWTSIVLREASLKQLNLIWKEGWRAPRRRENYVKHLYWHQLIIAKHHHHHRLRTCRKNQLMNVHVKVNNISFSEMIGVQENKSVYKGIIRKIIYIQLIKLLARNK